MDSYWNMIEPYWESYDFNDPDTFRVGVGNIPTGARHMLSAHWIYSEVCNGGFLQFFSNSTGLILPEAIDGLLAVGLPASAEVCVEAAQFFPTPFPRDRAERHRLLQIHTDQWPEDSMRQDYDPFFALDNRFYDALPSDHFCRMMDRYAQLTA